MPTADEYRRLAAECLQIAPSISPDLRGIFVALAKGWANLADYLDTSTGILPEPSPTGDGDGDGESAEDGSNYRSPRSK